MENLKEQPDFGENHIKSKDDLIVGKRYRSVLRTGRTVDFILTKAPYRHEYRNSLAIDTNLDKDIENFAFSPKFLADCGLEPYEDGWNPTNHLLKLEDEDYGS